MQNSVFSRQLVESIVDELKITDLAQATIGQVVLLASALEQRTGIPFIRMDQGVPGLSPNHLPGRRRRSGAQTRNLALRKGLPERRHHAGSLYSDYRIGRGIVRLVHRHEPVLAR